MVPVPAADYPPANARVDFEISASNKGGWRWWVAAAASGTRLGRRGFWIFQLIFWSVTAVTLVGALRIFSDREVELFVVAGRIFTGVVLTSLLYFLYRHRFTRSLESGTKLFWIVFLNFAAAFTGAGFWWGMTLLGWPEVPTDSPFTNFTLARMYSLLTWNAVYFGLELILDYHAARLDASEAREVARAAELKQLQTQLNPHFLFNALNTVIASLEPGHQTREIVKNLADYLRFSLHEAKSLEPLGRELDALESYFELQRVRFQEGLQCGIVCSPAAMRVLVPPMLVQPLLENAFKYGPMSSPLPLSVDVEAAVAAGWLEIRVTNSGAWVPPGSGDSHGSGLASLRRRLSLLVGDVATLQIDEGAERVCVTIRIPADPPAK